MDLANQILVDLLKNSNSPFLTSQNSSASLTATELATLYTNSALLGAALEFIKEQLWLQKKEDRSQGKTTGYTSFLLPYFQDELAPVVILQDFLLASGSEQLKSIAKNLRDIEARAIELVSQRSAMEQKDFLIRALQDMTAHFLHEERQQTGRSQALGHKGPRLYRTFDGIDQILDLNYRLDKDMKVDHAPKERLYQGAGVQVQSGYSTILLALQGVAPTTGDKIIDLGSGYGRVGLVFSLLAPHIDFIGYEYVPHRVEVANETCKALDLEDTLRFKAQDLSLDSFQIPDADVYYLYDPFTDATYQHVLKQIVAVSQRKGIRIVTKGNARGWLDEIAQEHCWPEPLVFDRGNLCIFRTF